MIKGGTPICLAVLVAMSTPATTNHQWRTDDPIRDRYVTTRSGLSLHYLESGDTVSPRAVVLIPGWRLPAYLWREQLIRLSRSARVIAVDSRSQGLSAQASDGNTPEVRATDLHDLLVALHVSRVVLVGWSQGAQDVASYVQQFGVDSIAGVVFVDSPVSFGPDEVQAHPAFAKSILANLAVYAAAPRAFSSGMVASLFRKPHPEIDTAEVVRATLRTPTSTGIAMLVADIFGKDRRPALAKLSVPTLVLASSASPLLDVQRKMATTLPGATFTVIKDAGHAVFLDAPDQFEAEVKVLLRSAGFVGDGPRRR